jgi:hypothetical protein
MFEKTLDLFEEMSFNPDEAVCTIVFQACSHLLDDRSKKIGKRLLQQMRNDLHTNHSLTSAIEMLMKFGDVKSAEYIFGQITTKNIFTYGAMMQGKILRCIFNHSCINLGYVENEMFEKALNSFEQMPFKPNEVIYSIFLHACAHLSSDQAKQIGKKLLEQMPNDLRTIRTLNSAINMLMNFGDVQAAEDIFEQITTKDIFTYGTMMKGKMLSCIFNYN